ncbi:YeiH family putative sulfate export transporter [Metabacillus sp. KIGAM252]|uniref:YeiH family putative sulfate export transporter n=1 Tax=Metabacillus flavus TaxID=2823519 RepID=A0ABS5LKM2_9BACI|nr:YeiH family protein [Metabacillus flavus]MBS2971013.1 YeiH family putative sulfate export transporter [Metabacillus flavus]
MEEAIERPIKQNINLGWIKGIGVTLLLAAAAKYLSGFPLLSILGQLVIALVLGMAWRAVFGVKEALIPGVSFSSKKLLRAGIILLGMRLNIADIYSAGWSVLAISIIHVVFALFVVYWLARWLGAEKKLSLLTACGTGICGAAAIAAISPQLKASDDETAISAAVIAVLGTLFTLTYTLIYSLLNLSPAEYGIFSGSTLHEVAHAVAAAAAGGGQAVDNAVLAKLTRVALLVPAAIVIGLIMQKGEPGTGRQKVSLSIVPWFIFGFLAMSGLNTLGVVPEAAAKTMVEISYLLIAMAMAGLGLNVNVKTFRTLGLKPFIAGLIGSILLSVLGYMLVKLLIG